MQQRKSSARHKAVTDAQRPAAQPLARPAKAPLSAPGSAPFSTATPSSETTLGGHVDRGLMLSALYDIGVLERLRIGVRLRLISDLTQSLAWLHANPRLMASHPHLVIAPSTVVIGLDGVARVDVRSAKKKDAERDPSEHDYIAPELASGAPGADLRADIYSVGVLAWEALAGARIGTATDPAASPGAEVSDGDVPLALRSPATQRDPLRRRPAGRGKEHQRSPPSITLPDDAAWARPLAELVLKALCQDPAERVPDCRPLLVELEAIAPFLAATHEIAEVVQGICNVETLCVPPPTLPDVDASCQAGGDELGFMDRQRCEDPRGLVCAQRERPTVHRVDAPAPVVQQPVVPQPAPRAASFVPRRAPKGSRSGLIWLIVGLVVLAVLGSVAGFVVSALAVR